MIRCRFCERPIDEERDYQQVVGYERIRPTASSKGKSLSAQRRLPERFVCASCLDDLRAGRTPGRQERMAI